MSINVEVLGGTVTLSHYVEEIAEKHHLRLASSSDGAIIGTDFREVILRQMELNRSFFQRKH